MTNPVILQGDLGAIGLADVLTFMSMVRKTGTLELFHDDIQKIIQLEQGEIGFASSNAPEDQLSRFLMQNGKITREQFDALQDRFEEGDTRVGKLLVQMGALTPKELWWGVQQHVLGIIYSLFAWTTGSFSFVETEVSTEEKITLNMSTTAMIMEGMRRLDEEARIQERIPNQQVIFARVPQDQNALAPLDLSTTELDVLEAVDGERPVHEINRSLNNLTDFDTRRILFSLLSARLIKPIGVERIRAPVFLDVEDEPELLKVTQTYNSMFAKLYEMLAEKVGSETAAQLFVKVLANQSEKELLDGIGFDSEGRFDEYLLIANVSELPLDQRRVELDEGLDTLLSYHLFEVTQYLDMDVKKKVYRLISDMKEALE